MQEITRCGKCHGLMVTDERLRFIQCPFCETKLDMWLKPWRAKVDYGILVVFDEQQYPKLGVGI